MNFTGIQILLSVALGFGFLVAAVPKLRHPRGFVLSVLEYRVLPYRLSWLYARLLPPLECLLALLLLSGTAVRSAAVVLALLLLSFIVAIGVNMARGREFDCHCFGRTGGKPIGWGSLLRNVVLFCAAITLAAFSSQWLAPESWSVFRFAGLAQAGSLGPLLACAAVTACIVTLLGRLTYGKRRTWSAQVSRK